ncbi:FAD-binding domain-containing [Fusarium acutatum]|uniref:FAD-binding domain-containing n=1 Tax=Fusarium acutatum TaxID=78861 RepID=A0A8H4JBV9_9HYPO|nr:FAD-binding domain-containing [Fusarium acutatum]
MTLLTNWNDEIRFEVADDHLKRPAQVRDVEAIIRRANEQNQEGLTVTVEGGVTMRQLYAHLRELSLQPPVVLEYGNFQIGAISGTHANDTAIRRSVQFLSFVLSVMLITPTGEVMEISESRNAEYLPAIRSHFGMLGVICEIIPYSRYTIDPYDRAVIYTEDNPNFDFYDWVFLEAQWCEMVQAFLQLSRRFQQQHGFILPLPALIYFIEQDQASLLLRSRSVNMMAIDPLFPDPKDPTWKEFRLVFNKIAMTHGGIPHINKTRDGAINHFAQAHDPDSIRHFLQIRQ